MKLIEYRIFVPLTLDEDQVGQRYTLTKLQALNTSGGEGVEILQDDYFRLNVDSNGRFQVKDLPEYEDFDTQKGKKSPLATTPTTPGGTNQPPLIGSAPTQEQPSDTKKASELESSANAASAPATVFYKTIPETEEKSKFALYQRKIYKIASKFPWYIQKLSPKDMLILKEKSWYAYPQSKLVLWSDFFKSSFRIEMDSIVKECPNGVPEENVHNLTPDQLSKREVVELDITDMDLTSDKYRADLDPSKFRSVKTGRGPLARNDWIKNQKPLSCVYKLVMVEFKLLGVQKMIENFGKNTYKELFADFHRQQFCLMDQWYGLTFDEVRRMEDELVQILNKNINEGELKLTSVQVDVQ
jgi:hypothetical protein